MGTYRYTKNVDDALENLKRSRVFCEGNRPRGQRRREQMKFNMDEVPGKLISPMEFITEDIWAQALTEYYEHLDATLPQEQRNDDARGPQEHWPLPKNVPGVMKVLREQVEKELFSQSPYRIGLALEDAIGFQRDWLDEAMRRLELSAVAAYEIYPMEIWMQVLLKFHELRKSKGSVRNAAMREIFQGHDEDLYRAHVSQI